MKHKEQLLTSCQEFINSKRKTIEQTIASNKHALLSETKSSAGDKHETGRAMLQLEMEKAGQQLKEVQEMQGQLDKINVASQTANVHLGSIVKTNIASYFISISKGQIACENEMYFAISSQSPIGKLLLGKKVDEVVVFRNQQIKIIKIL